MANSLQLVWNNPHPAPHFTVNARMLAELSDAVIARVKDDQLLTARGLMALYALSPIAVGVVAARLFRAGVPEDVVLKIV